ncbi:MAG TPA: Scr1 family TA system antitoxin-like transcriptional regulator [Candidatus Saccharimonadales bacterium]|nr:Scr1 family TA system antitoxin-like transcriptional regulator [Candidatus Saccharimonadales bacterium]
MSRFDFGSLKSEPGGLADMYRVFADARETVHAESYLVPAELQTEAYAKAVITRANGPELADARVATRMLREATLNEATDRVVYLAAAALSHVHLADRHIMLAQLGVVRKAVEFDIERGPDSRLRVGIVPTDYIKPLPPDLPQGMALTTPRDIVEVLTPNGVFIMGGDQFEVDRLGDLGDRGREALRRQAILGDWAATAVFGEEALTLIEESRATLLTA